MIKPDAYSNIGKIISRIENSGFLIDKIKMSRMTLNDAKEFYIEHLVKIYLIYFIVILIFILLKILKKFNFCQNNNKYKVKLIC